MNEEASRQQDEDRRLIAACAAGDSAAFASLYDRLSGPLYGLCLRMTGEVAEAEDIIQEAFLTIWRRAGAYDPTRGSVFNWAVHLTRCKVVDHLRARGRRLRVMAPAEPAANGDERPTPEPHAPNPAAGEAADQRARAGRVRRGLDALPPDQGRAIELAFFSDLTHHEISARLGQPLGTVKARIRRGCCGYVPCSRGGTRGGPMISEEQQDQASLYALGLLDADEAAEFERAQAADGELRTLADEFREAAASLARTDAGGAVPPTWLKESVLARVAAEASGEPAAGKIITLPSWWSTWFPWAAAAVLMVACIVLGALGLNFAHLAMINDRQLADATSRARAAEAALAAARGGALANVSYCALDPVPKAQGAGPQAAVLWDAASRRGRLQIHKLPPPGTGKDYQLWTVEAGHKNPISAGVVRLDADGGAVVDFQPGAGDDAGAAVAAFALSVERAGGVENNEGPILFLGKLAP